MTRATTLSRWTSTSRPFTISAGDRALFASALLAALSACSGDTDIIGRCIPTTDPAVLLSGSNGGDYVWWSPSVGLIDGHVWVTYVQNIDGKWLGLGRWYDATTLAAESEPVRLGTVDIWELQNWARDGDSLVGQVWADPAEPAEISSDDGLVHLWRVTPPPDATANGQRIALTTYDPADNPFPLVPGRRRTITLSDLYAAGFQGALSVAVVGRAVVGALGAVAPCPGVAFGGVSVHSFGGDYAASRLPFPTVDCAIGGAGVPWLFPLDGDEVGLLYRHGEVDDHEVRYARLDARGQPTSSSRIVGGGENTPCCDVTGGFQPRGVRVRDHVLFTERRGDSSFCYTVRVMDLDGDDVDDAPWQLPCADDGGDGDGPVVTWIHQLVAVPGAAVLVWQERTNLFVGEAFTEDITDPARYHEGVFAVMLTEDGKRGSAVMELTTPEFTAAEVDAAGTPVFALDTDVQVAADGNEVFATWIDRRAPTAPGPLAGYHARSFRCVVDP